MEILQISARFRICLCAIFFRLNSQAGRGIFQTKGENCAVLACQLKLGELRRICLPIFFLTHVRANWLYLQKKCYAITAAQLDQFKSTSNWQLWRYIPSEAGMQTRKNSVSSQLMIAWHPRNLFHTDLAPTHAWNEQKVVQLIFQLRAVTCVVTEQVAVYTHRYIDCYVCCSGQGAVHK